MPKIVIEIRDEKQAQTFVKWVENRGDLLMGDYCDFKPAEGMENEEAKARYVYITSAHKSE